MVITNTASPTRLKKYNYNWYAVAAVATALQMSVDSDTEAKGLTKATRINIRDFYVGGSATPSSSTMLALDNRNFEATVNTVLANTDIEENDDFADIAIKPKYVKEFKIRVATLKIDKSLPKIFVD